MDILRAKEIIEALAEGVDPATGELLPQESVFNQGDVVRALYSVLNYINQSEQSQSKSKNKRVEEPEVYDEVLYERLKALRTEIAVAKGMKAFQVFANAPLKEMAIHLPTTPEAFLQIRGVGPTTAKLYGDLFLTAIQGYLQENGRLNG